jgi:ammonium transporter, Amt family
MVGVVSRYRRFIAVFVGGLVALALISSAAAQEPTTQDQINDLVTGLDSAWLMLAAFLVFFMQAGFAMVEAGFVRSKNVGNILMKNLLDACVGCLAFFAVGWGLAYGLSGDASSGFAGNGHFFLHDFHDWPAWIFQFAFAATAATIVSGAMAERTKFSAYLVYSAFITALVYPIVVHWAWDSNGWLTAFKDDPIGANGYIDFAGSGVVHMVGGFAGLVGAMVVGPRLGRYGSAGKPIAGHSISLATLGVFILWFGWYGFNPGSTLALSGGFAAIAAKVAVNTTLAAGAGAVATVFLSKMRTGYYDVGLVLNGTLAGLVAITAPCATVEPWAAVLIGMIASPVMMIAVETLDKLKIDDPVGAVAVHGFGGLWGVLSVGLFSSQTGIGNAYAPTDSYGLFLGGGFGQLGIQALGAFAIIGWTVATSAVLFLALKFTIGLRVSPEEEEKGLDFFEHGSQAYPDFTPAPTFAPAPQGAAVSGALRAQPMPGGAGGGGGGS